MPSCFTGGYYKKKLIDKPGGYGKLKSYQLSQLIYDITHRFCKKIVSSFSRIQDQMVQAARSGVQNIAEGSQASDTSKKTELKLTNLARTSLEELKLDYQDFLRQRKLSFWSYNDPCGKKLISQRLRTADEFSLWVKHLNERSGEGVAQIAANGVLLSVTCTLLNRQIAAQAEAFQRQGGFTERLYRMRSNARK